MQFEIVSLKDETRDWQAHGKTNRSWRGDLRDANGQTWEFVEISRQVKADGSVKAPSVGEQVEGSLEERGDFGLKFKADYSNNRSGGGSGSAGGNGGESGWTPEREAGVIESHSQRVAVMWAQAKAQAGQLPPDFTTDKLGSLIDFFTNRVRAKQDAARASGAAQNGSPAGNSLPAASATPSTPDKITQAQLETFIPGKQRQFGVSDENLRLLLGRRFGVQALADLPKSRVNELAEAMAEPIPDGTSDIPETDGPAPMGAASTSDDDIPFAFQVVPTFTEAKAHENR